MSWKRIIKFELTGADGKAINPVSAFTRFGCWSHGPRSYLAVLRGIFATMIGVTIFVDWGLIDHLARYKREAHDGDNVWFWFRPQDWIHLAAAIMLLLMIIASGFKREDTETETRYPKTYLAIWNLIIAVIPLSAASLIMYYQVLRWDHSYDAAYEATVTQVFIVSCLELLWGARPAEWSDIFLPTLLSLGFVLYTVVLAKGFNLDLYTQLDWNNTPKIALANASIFMATVVACATVSTFIAIRLNRFWDRRRGSSSYLPVETAPLKGFGA